MTLIVPILSMLSGQIAVWIMVVLLVANAPNSSPVQEAATKGWCLSIGAVGLISLVTAIRLLAIHRAARSSVVGAVPVAFCIVVFFFVLKAQS